MPTDMTLSEIIQPAHIVPDLQATNRWEAIDELVDNLIEHGAIAAVDREAIIDVVKKREEKMSTGIGYGVGIPHAASDLIDDVVGALGRSKGGIDFDALDNQPVNFVVLFLVPKGKFQAHLNALAQIAKQMHNSALRKALEQAEDAESIKRIIQEPFNP